MPLDNDINFYGLKIKLVNKDDFYKTRIKPYLLFYGRCQIYNIIMTKIYHLVCVHTNGIILKRPINKNQIYIK